MTLTKSRKLRVINITVDFIFTEVKCCIINFMYPTVFIHSNALNVIQCKKSEKEQSSRAENKKPPPAFNIRTCIKINLISHEGRGEVLVKLYKDNYLI